MGGVAVIFVLVGWIDFVNELAHDNILLGIAALWGPGIVLSFGYTIWQRRRLVAAVEKAASNKDWDSAPISN